MDAAAAGVAPGDAAVAIEVRRDNRLAAARQVVGRGDGEHRRLCTQTNRDRVLVQAFADADASIEASGNDVAETVIDDEIQDDVWIGPVEASESRRDQVQGG